MRWSSVDVSLELDSALARSVDPPYIVGDPTRMHDLTGWSPRIAALTRAWETYSTRIAAAHPAAPTARY